MDIPSIINPNIQDPSQNNILYNLHKDHAQQDGEGNMYFRIPYSPNVFWTHFKYSCWGINQSLTEDLKIGIILWTSDEFIYKIQPSTGKTQHVWHNTTWPFPSIKTPNKAGIYFKIKPLANKYLEYDFRLTILGYKDLFPNKNHYLLVTPQNKYQYVFHNYAISDDQSDNTIMSGTIYNVENDDYVNDILDRAVIIQPIGKY